MTIRIRLAHGGEVGYDGELSALEEMHPGAVIVSNDDGTPYTGAPPAGQAQTPDNAPLVTPAAYPSPVVPTTAPPSEETPA